MFSPRTRQASLITGKNTISGIAPSSNFSNCHHLQNSCWLETAIGVSNK
jgi:hypothetical protein